MAFVLPDHYDFAPTARRKRALQVQKAVQELRGKWEPSEHGRIVPRVAEEQFLSTSTVYRYLDEVGEPPPTRTDR